MRRVYMISTIVAGLAVFLVLSALLARALSVGGAEDSAITDLVRAEARGDTPFVIRAISGCATRPACRARASSVTASLRRAGSVSIILIEPSAGFALGSTAGVARVAWLVGGSLPRVQCVRVQHAGNVLAGFQVRLIGLSVRIRSDAACPSRF